MRHYKLRTDGPGRSSRVARAGCSTISPAADCYELADLIAKEALIYGSRTKLEHRPARALDSQFG